MSVRLARQVGAFGLLVPGRQGRPRGSDELEPHAAFLLGAFKAQLEITMPELREYHMISGCAAAALEDEAKARFRFHHVSTDEVFGSLGSSDHLARASHHTYGLPHVASGPPLSREADSAVVLNALEGKPLPVYGTGANVRDWLCVEDHARALVEIATRGEVGESYNVGGWNERRNIDVVEAICDLVDEMAAAGRLPDLPTSNPVRQRRLSFETIACGDIAATQRGCSVTLLRPSALRPRRRSLSDNDVQLSTGDTISDV